MKIVFVNPPYSGGYMEAEDCCFAFKSKRYLPSLILACASEYDNAKFVDLTIDSVDTLLAMKPDAVVYCLIPLDGYVAVHQQMSKICHDAGIKQIVISVPPGYADDFLRLNPEPFCVIYSEPEMLFRRLNNYSDLESWRDDMDGLVYRGKNMSESIYLPNSFHELVPMNFELVPNRYWSKYYQVIYQVTRGCPYRCSFCTWGGSTVTDRTFRTRPADQVADDLQQLSLILPKKGLYILSSQLTTNLSWIKQFHNRMASKPYQFSSNINLHESTHEKLTLLRQSGMFQAGIGLEGLCNSVLSRIGKPHTIEDAFRVIPILEDIGMRYTMHLRFGVNETKSEIAESIHNFHKLTDMVDIGKVSGIGPLMYFKGTELYDNPTMLPIPISSVKTCYTKPGFRGECATFPDGIGELISVVRGTKQ